jgi:hypothetical protein
VNKKLLVSLFAFALLLGALVLGLGSPARTESTATPQRADVGSYLPPSDGVAIVDSRRLLNETVPRILAADPAKLAQANAEVEKFKTRTGVDPRSFDRLTVGTVFTYPSPKVTRLETVAIAHGTFDPKAIATAARTNAKYREEKYRGATIMVVTINEEMKLLGLLNMRLNEVAICVLDANTLAIGNVSRVRAAIDTGKAGGKNAELIALAAQDPSAVMGFGANLSRELTSKLDIGNDTIAKDASSIRQAYGSVGSTDNDVSVLLVARTDSAEAAKNLSDTVEGLKQLGAIFVPRLAPPKRALAQSALDSLKITTRGTEIELRLQVAASTLASVIK